MIARLEWPTDATVYAIDDDNSFRQSILRALSVAGLRAVGYGSAGDFLIDRVREQSQEGPACILLDIAMPGPSGIELMKALASRDSGPPIIFITGRDDIFTSVNMMKCGAVDYLVKPVSTERLLQSIYKALNLDSERRAARHEVHELLRRFNTLTHAECAVFHGVVNHRLNKQMAVELSVCERTVKTLRSRMMDKMQLMTVPELVRGSALLEAAGAEIIVPRRAPRSLIERGHNVQHEGCFS